VASFSGLHRLLAGHGVSRDKEVDVHERTLLLLSEHGGVCQRNDHGPFRIADTELALQAADDVLGLLVQARRKQLRDDRHLLRLRLETQSALAITRGASATDRVPGAHRDVLQVTEHEGHSEWLGLE
jgi:hypothetical protein